MSYRARHAGRVARVLGGGAERALSGADGMSVDTTLSERAAERANGHHAGFWTLCLGSVGVVYGDIGTSPLYAFREAVLAGTHHTGATREVVIAVLSLIIWALNSHCHSQICPPSPARGQSRGRRHALPHGACPQGAGRPVGHGAVEPDLPDGDRCRIPILRRRDDHAGHLRPVGGRGPQGDHSVASTSSCCRSRSPSCSGCSPCRAAERSASRGGSGR